ncbi:MAG: hypothetical protein AAF676_13760 [Pseudomonadota bacterium]
MSAEMTPNADPTLGPGDMPALEKAARLPLTPERREEAAATLDGMLALFDALDDVDLGEIAPTNSFDPRWRTLP